MPKRGKPFFPLPRSVVREALFRARLSSPGHRGLAGELRRLEEELKALGLPREPGPADLARSAGSEPAGGGRPA